MSLELWLAFVLASAIILAIPGPTILLVCSYCMTHGPGVLWRVVPGVLLGDLLAMTVSLAGLGALLSASAELFTALKLVGAAYLVYLGVKRWRAATALTSANSQEPRYGSVAVHAFVVTALNPKSIAFFVAFLPHFIDTTAPLVPQMVILVATFLALALIDAVIYGMVAARMQQLLGPGRRGLVERIGGATLIGAGAWMASLSNR